MVYAASPPISIPSASSRSSSGSMASYDSSHDFFRASSSRGGHSCAFPCWPDRTSLKAMPETGTSSYISDDELFPDPFEQAPEEPMEVVVCPRTRLARFDPASRFPAQKEVAPPPALPNARQGCLKTQRPDRAPRKEKKVSILLPSEQSPH